MWKYLIFVISVVTVNAVITNTEQLAGQWYLSATFPPFQTDRTCGKFTFAKHPEHPECTCDDGKNATLINIIDIVTQQDGKLNLKQTLSFPVMAVENFNEVAPLLNVTCNGTVYNMGSSLIVVRFVNENTCVLYKSIDNNEPNTAMLLTKYALPLKGLLDVIKSVHDLKERAYDKGCTVESLLNMEIERRQ